MFKKLKYILFVILIFSTYASENRLDVQTDEATIDFQNEEFSADGGVSFIYPNADQTKTAKIKAYKLKKLLDKNMIVASDRVIFEQGANKVEAQDIYFNLDDQSIIVRDGISYVVVNEAPVLNNKIYYGGEEFQAKFPDEAYVKNAWFTTSKKALELKDSNQDPKEVLPYHMKAKKISIYPDDKIIAYNSVLYAGKIPILWLPWYATSLKSDTKAPLFPLIGSTSTEGTYILWGLDYGRKNNYLNGSVALKNTSKKGLYIGQWDNVYKINGADNNKGKLSLSDALILPKGDYEPEYKFEYTHNYKGKYGSLDWKFNHQTINTINTIKEQLESANGSTDGIDLTGIEKKLTRYELATDLTGMGKDKDMSLKANIQYVDNKQFMKALLGEINKDKTKDTESDNDIKSNIDFKKDNFLYGLNLKYEYLDDLDPGSQKADTTSYTNGISGGLNLKKYGINIQLNEKKWDSWRTLSDSERYNGGKYLNEVSGWAKDFSYVPFTVKKSELYKNEKKLDLGSYSLFNGFINYSVNFFENINEETLSREHDPFRESLSGLTDREKEYNRDENILYKKTENQYGKVNFGHDKLSLGLELGKEREEYVDRQNTDDNTKDGIRYINNSTYNDIDVRDSLINLKNLGTLDLKLGRRLDQFQRGDELTKYYTDLTHKIKLYDNSGNYLRKMDLTLNNNFSLYLDENLFDKSNYDFSSIDGITNVSKEEDLKLYRLGSRQNNVGLKNNITFGLGNTATTYGFNSKKSYNSYDREWLQTNKFENSLDFKVDEKRTAFISYGISETNQKNDMDQRALSDSSSDVTEIYTEKYFREQKTETVNLTLADDIKEWSLTRSDYRKDNREKFTYYTDGTNLIDLSDRTTTYGKISTIDKTIDNTLSYGQKLNDISSYKLSAGLGESSVYNMSNSDYDSKGNRVKFGFEWNTKDLYTLKVNFEDYKDKVDTINDEKRLIIRYDYKKSNLPKSGNEKKVELTDSTGETRLNLTEAELMALDKEYREEKRKEKGQGFDIMGIGEKEPEVIYNQYYTLYIDGIRNEDYYNSSKNIIDSLEALQIKGEFHYKRFKLNYDYNLKAYFSSDSTQLYGIAKSVETKTQEISALTMIGKDTESWKVKGSIRLNENTKGVDEGLDKWTVSLGKEFEFMSTTVEYEQEWNKTSKEYEWIWKLKFELLTFPDKGVGIGTSYKNGQTSTEFKTGI